MPLTRGSVRCRGGLVPPKIAAPFAPGACTKTSASGPSCPAHPVSVSLMSLSSTACRTGGLAQDPKREYAEYHTTTMGRCMQSKSAGGQTSL